jgi:hypothetical protein
MRDAVLLVSHELEAEAGEALVRTTVSPPLQAMLAINRGESLETPDMAALREQADVQQTFATMVQDITTVHRIIAALGNSA